MSLVNSEPGFGTSQTYEKPFKLDWMTHRSINPFCPRSNKFLQKVSFSEKYFSSCDILKIWNALWTCVRIRTSSLKLSNWKQSLQLNENFWKHPLTKSFYALQWKLLTLQKYNYEITKIWLCNYRNLISKEKNNWEIIEMWFWNPGWRLRWPSTGGWGQVRATATEDLQILSENVDFLGWKWEFYKHICSWL